MSFAEAGDIISAIAANSWRPIRKETVQA